MSPTTVKVSFMITSSGKPTVTVPLFPAVSEIATWLVVPAIVTTDLIPEPEPPAVKLRTAVLTVPAATGNVYVSFVFEGAAYVTTLFVLSKETLAPPVAANRKSTVSVTLNCSVPLILAMPNEVVSVPVIVTAPVDWSIDMLVPATMLVTPVLLIQVQPSSSRLLIR